MAHERIQAADRARFLAADASGWIKVRLKSGRPIAYGVPSATQPGVFHLVDTRQCSCPAFRFRAECYHHLAVVSHVRQVRQQGVA